MSVRRAVALTLALCAIAVGALALPWYGADLPDRTVTANGPESARVLWIIVPIAVAIAVLVVRAGRRGALTAPAAWTSLMIGAALAAIGCAVALVVALGPAVGFRAVGVADPPLVGADRLPAGFVVAGAFAGVASLLLSWMIGIANAVEDHPTA